MDKHKQINESILLGYFTGTLSIPLQQEVEDWISASEENKKIARDIQSICLATETLTCIRQTDSGTALKKVKSKIHSHRKISLSAWIQRIAAILILPLIISTIKTKVNVSLSAPHLISKQKYSVPNSIWKPMQPTAA